MRSRGALEAVFLLVLVAARPFLSIAQDSETADTSDTERKNSFPYEPIADVDASAYIGRWFQTYASASVIYTFELGGNCVTADYFATDKDRTIRVKNTVRPLGGRARKYMGWFGDVVGYCLELVVNGYLSQSPDVDGQGYVELQPGPLPLGIGTPDIDDVMYQEPGNYWIIELGPIKNGQYRWAMVTDDVQVQLYFLARDVEEFEALYEHEALALAKAYGFTTPTNKPIKTNQEDCGYRHQRGGGSSDSHSYEDDHYYDDYYEDDYYSKDKYDDDYYNDDHH